tara:strand:- start:19430 stop:19627 length:198 start_codon:yes stop_codon:yes gene_type:complete
VIKHLIKKYAIAQYHMGIKHTLKVKRSIVGYEPLINAPLKKVKRLIETLRKHFKNNKGELNNGKN